MKLLEIKDLALSGVQVLRFQRFRDARGYFTESFRRSDIDSQEGLHGLRHVPVVQTNEAYSRAGTLRGLHFQWNPYVGKLVRPLYGRIVDLVLDIRIGSPTFGCAVAYEMCTDSESEWGQWIWVPPGFAHGTLASCDTLVEYHCTGEYNPACEAGIAPFAADIQWSLCPVHLKAEFDALAGGNHLMSDKDKNGMTLAEWMVDQRSKNFVYGKC